MRVSGRRSCSDRARFGPGSLAMTMSLTRGRSARRAPGQSPVPATGSGVSSTWWPASTESAPSRPGRPRRPPPAGRPWRGRPPPAPWRRRATAPVWPPRGRPRLPGSERSPRCPRPARRRARPFRRSARPRRTRSRAPFRSPCPSLLVVKNGSNARAETSGVMPSPSSRTRRRTWLPASTSSVSIQTVPPSGIASRALTTRFIRTCSIWVGSASIKAAPSAGRAPASRAR